MHNHQPYLKPEWKTSFNEAATEYDKLRPTYVPELYNDIIAYSGLNENNHVLEIGIGTGQATLPILNTNCKLIAIELGSELAERAQSNFAQYKNFEVKNMAFEDYNCPNNTFDMVYSASAFHWIPEELGYSKVFNLLKSGGTFARFAIHPYKDKGNEPLHIAIQKVYAKYMPQIANKLRGEYSETDAQSVSNLATKYGFVDSAYKLYHRIRTFNANDYGTLISTYSDHRALGEAGLTSLVSEINEAINNHGGVINIYDTLSLNLARKP